MQPVATISIALMPDGNLAIQCQVPNRYTLNAMLEVAKQNLVSQLMEAERNAPKVALPPPGLSGTNLRN